MRNVTPKTTADPRNDEIDPTTGKPYPGKFVTTGKSSTEPASGPLTNQAAVLKKREKVMKGSVT